MKLRIPCILFTLGTVWLAQLPIDSTSLLAQVAEDSSGITEAIDFNQHIRPILVKRCFSCHGPDEDSREGSLGLHDRAMVTSELDSGEIGIVPNKPEASEVFRRITSADTSERMPPEDVAPPLTDEEIELVRRWIEGGANYELHWAFNPVVRPDIPNVNSDWIRNPIDAFVLRKLEASGLAPTEEATRETLIRRLSLDLVGLPPTPDETERFVHDASPSAYENLVDRLLSEPAFGEHSARHWLDLARYADSQGYAQDEIRTIWPYRDWVIKAFNQDMPFDQFTLEQLAGDLLPNPTTDQLVATGFHRNTMTNTEGGTDDEEYRHAAVVDRTNTTAQVWMGLTMGCAQCHTHKFDPITHQEYYQFFAIFNQTADNDQPDNRPTISFFDERQKQELSKLNERLKSLIDVDDQSPAQLERVATELDEIKKQIAAFSFSRTPVMSELSAEQTRKTHVAIRGAYLNHGNEVAAGFPEFLGGVESSTDDQPTVPNRLQLAKWLTSGAHPLTARVEANRIWEQIFGAGIVETSEDFGSQGSQPTHPELLDWLADLLVTNGWSRKQLCKTIVMSATYRQVSKATPEVLAIDPFNRLLSRGARYRLSAEQIRDYALKTSGLMSKKMFGPPVRPPQPISGQSAAFGGSLDWEASQGEDRYRRAIYTLWRRTNPYPSFMALDATDRKVCTMRRIRTNTPVASFVTLNDPAFIEAAVATAQKITEHTDDRKRRIEFSFGLIVGRKPTSSEFEVVNQLLEQQLEYYEGNSAACDELIATYEPAKQVDASKRTALAAWTMIANTLLNLDEALTRN